MNLSLLSRDVLNHIAQFFETRSLTCLSLTCCRLYRLFKAHPKMKGWLQARNTHPWDKSYFNPLQYACSQGDVELVEYCIFISHGADDWEYALMCAAGGGNLSCVKMVLEQTPFGISDAVNSAVRAGHLHIVQHLCGNAVYRLKSALETATRYNRPMVEEICVLISLLESNSKRIKTS